MNLHEWQDMVLSESGGMTTEEKLAVIADVFDDWWKLQGNRWTHSNDTEGSFNRRAYIDKLPNHQAIMDGAINAMVHAMKKAGVVRPRRGTEGNVKNVDLVAPGAGSGAVVDWKSKSSGLYLQLRMSKGYGKRGRKEFQVWARRGYGGKRNEFGG